MFVLQAVTEDMVAVLEGFTRHKKLLPKQVQWVIGWWKYDTNVVLVVGSRIHLELSWFAVCSNLW